MLLDMETRDPDDILTLCLLVTHPDVELLAVTLNPGTYRQIGIVRRVLERLGRSIPIGARNLESDAHAVSPFHDAWLGDVTDADPDRIAHELLADALAARADAVLLTCAPLHNLRLLLRNHLQVRIQRWVTQGGFAGDNAVPPELRLPKFDGRITCESFNFGGDKKAAQLALASDRIALRQLISKNVTHGVAWDSELHRRIGATDVPEGVRLMHDAMELYLSEHPEGKLLHDPLAACAAIDPSFVTWAEVTPIYREGQWGCEPAQGSGTFISVAIDRERFLATMTRTSGS